MNISREILEKACKETLNNYSCDENEEKSFHEMEKIAAKFSDSVMRRALKMALEESKNDKKKPYVKSVEKMLSQLDSDKEYF